MSRPDRRDLEACLWFLIAPVVFFREAAFGKAFFHYDSWMHYFATRAWWFDQFRDGHFAFWSSGLFAGYPLFAESQTAPLYPTTFALFSLLPATVAYAWDIILQFAWAGFGAYRLARTLETRHTSALFTGTLYAFSGFLITHLLHFNLLAGAAWLPWIVWGTLGALRGRRGPSVVLAAGWAALSLAPHPNGTILAALAVAFTLVLTLAGGAERMRGYARAAVATAAGLLAGAVQTLATMSLLGETERSAGANEAFRALGSLPPWNVLHAAIPDLQGTPRLDTWFGGLDWSLYAETCFYFGVSAVPFACAGLFCLRGRIPLALATGGALSFAVMLGGFGILWQALGALPLLDATRIPARFAVPFLLCVAILAGRGLDATVRRRSRLSLAVSAAATTLITGLALFAHHTWGTPNDALVTAAGEGSALAIEWTGRVEALRDSMTGVRVHAIVFAAAGIALLALFTYARYAVPLRYAPVAVVFVDLFLWGRGWNPVIEPARMLAPPPAVGAVAGRIDHAPRFARQDIDEIWSSRPARDRVDPFTPGWDANRRGAHASASGDRHATASWSLTPNVGLLYGAQSAEGFTPLVPTAWREWIGLPAGALGIPRPRYTERQLDLLSVDAVLSSRRGAPLPGGLFLTANDDAMPRARLSTSWNVVTDRDALLARLRSVDHDPGSRTLVERDLRVDALKGDGAREDAATGAGASGTVAFPGAATRPLPFESTGPNTRTVTVDRPGLVVLAETFAPGWSVVGPDGNTIETVRADGLFLAFPADRAGTHAIEYRPGWLSRGLVLSGCGVAMIGLLIVFPAGRPPETAAHDPSRDEDAPLTGAAPPHPRFASAPLLPVGAALLALVAAGAIVQKDAWSRAWHTRTLPNAAAAAWSESGFAALQAGAHRPALRMLEQSTRIDNRNPVTHFRIGLAHEAAGRPGLALRSYENALAIDPDFEPAERKVSP